MTELAAGGIVPVTGVLAEIGTGGPEWVLPLGRPSEGTPEVFEAADAVEAKLPQPVPGNNRGTVGERLDEAMRSRLLELGKPVI
jgi:hypothetical protein